MFYTLKVKKYILIYRVYKDEILKNIRIRNIWAEFKALNLIKVPNFAFIQIWLSLTTTVPNFCRNDYRMVCQNMIQNMTYE